MNTPSEENVEKRQMIWVWVFVCVLFGADFLYGLYGAFTAASTSPSEGTAGRLAISPARQRGPTRAGRLWYGSQ